MWPWPNIRFCSYFASLKAQLSNWRKLFINLDFFGMSKMQCNSRNSQKQSSHRKLRFHFTIIQKFTLFSFLLLRCLHRCENCSQLKVIDFSLIKIFTVVWLFSFLVFFEQIEHRKQNSKNDLNSGKRKGDQ